MTKFTTLLVAVLLIAGLTSVPSYGAKQQEKLQKPAATKPETYVVVQIGPEELKVVTKSELKDLRKSVAEEDKKKKKEYDEAMKTAKGKDKADLVKPVKRLVKTVPGSPTFKTKEDAEDWKEKHPSGKQDADKKKDTAKKPVF
jgi:hypothetical protein